MSKNEKLTLKQERFCDEYIANGGNATEAYKAAGYSQNMKPESMNNIAHRILQNVNVMSRIEELRTKEREKFELTRESVTKGLLEFVSLAKETEQLSAGVKAYDSLIKLHDLTKKPDENKEEHQPLTINFNVSEPVEKESIKIKKHE